MARADRPEWSGIVAVVLRITWLVLRSSKQVGKAAPAESGRWRGPSPDPRSGMGVELGGGHLGGLGDLTRVGEGLPGQSVPAKGPPPGLLQVQPAGALGNELELTRSGGHRIAAVWGSDRGGESVRGLEG